MGIPKQIILRIASNLSSHADKEFADRLLWAGSLLDLDPADALSSIGNSPAVFETVPAAFYCFIRFEPEEALIHAANGGGDTDSIASMSGALAGAFYGSSWLPERWLSRLEGRKRLMQTAESLADLCISLCGV
jgi:ADP-ribosylglycohydrolase